MRFSLGTRTSVKNTSLKSQNSLSESSGNGRRSTPGRRGVDDQRADALVLRRGRDRCARSTGTSRRGARPTSTPSARSRRTRRRRARHASSGSRGRCPRPARSCRGTTRSRRAASGGGTAPSARRAVVVDRRGDDAEPLRVRAAQDLAAAHLLEIDHLLRRRSRCGHRARAASPGRASPRRTATRCQSRAHCGMSRARLLRLGEPVVGRLVLVEPRVELGAERLVFGCVVQAHRGAG